MANGPELVELSRTLGSAVARHAESLVGQSKKAVIAVSLLQLFSESGSGREGRELTRLRFLRFSFPQDGTSFGFVSETLYMAHCKGKYHHL